MKKEIETILSPPPSHMVGDGFRVHNFFPSGYGLGLKRMSPFFMMDYNAKVEFPPSKNPRGVGVHPHRGFETVTLAYHGAVAHHDSAGNSGVIYPGGVQWMTAASGVLHKEYHEKEFSRAGGAFQMVQLWVNLPAQYKMSNPKYQSVSKEQMKHYTLPDNMGRVDIVAGEFKGIDGSASTFSAMHVYNLYLKAGAAINFDLPETFNTGILQIDGNSIINGENLMSDHFMLFKNKGSEIAIETTTDATLLVLSGEPIHEPIVAYGPFLMNTKEEIIQAYDDMNAGKFGYLED